MNVARRRLDNELVRRCMAPSRAAAQALISGGRVLVGGSVAHKPSRMVAAAEPVHLSGEPPRFVSRGGDKIDAALDTFGIAVARRRVVDAGSGTGGFVDCLLQRRAAQVVAVDVGWGQLDARLRDDPRVIVRERCNVRHVGPADIGGVADIVTADLSFISLETVMPNLAACTAPGGDAVLLVKPQFEAGRREASRGKGVVRDPEVWRRVLSDVAARASVNGLAPCGVTASPLRGAAGNAEFFLHCQRVVEGACAATEDAEPRAFDLEAAIEIAVEIALEAPPPAAAAGAGGIPAAGEASA